MCLIYYLCGHFSQNQEVQVNIFFKNILPHWVVHHNIYILVVFWFYFEQYKQKTFELVYGKVKMHEQSKDFYFRSMNEIIIVEIKHHLIYFFCWYQRLMNIDITETRRKYIIRLGSGTKMYP